MRAAVIVVHHEASVRELAVTALRFAGLESIGFHDPVIALDWFDSHARVLVTGIAFGPGKPNGIALARMFRLRRAGNAVVFVASSESEDAVYAGDLGTFMPMPLDAFQLVDRVSCLLMADARGVRAPARGE